MVSLQPVFEHCPAQSHSNVLRFSCSIPVLFSPDSDGVSPWHWGPFREESRVLLSAVEYLALPPGDAGLRVLLDMPPERVSALQASISRNAHRLQYALEDMPSGDDALEVLLKKAHLRAQGVSLDELSSHW